MIKKVLIIILLLISSNCFSDQKNNNTFKLYFSVKHDFTDQNIYRGATLNWSRLITEDFYWGISTRIINDDYTSLWAKLGYSFKLNSYLYIPLDVGAGLKIKSIKLLEDTSEGLSPFVHGQTGLDWIIDNNWRYILHGTYNYNLLAEKQHNILLNLGIMYIF